MKPDLTGLNLGPMPSAWDYNEHVQVIKGEHASKSGLLKHCREEGKQMRAEIELQDKTRIWCYVSDLQTPSDRDGFFAVTLIMPESEIPAWEARIKELQG